MNTQAILTIPIMLILTPKPVYVHVSIQHKPENNFVVLDLFIIMTIQTNEVCH